MAPPSASLRGSAFVYFRRFPPLRNLQQPALRALFCIHVGIEKYPPPRKFRGLGSRLYPCHPSVCDPAPAALSISFRLQKAYNTDAAMVAKSPLRDEVLQIFPSPANFGLSMAVLYLRWRKMSICLALFNDWLSRK